MNPSRLSISLDRTLAWRKKEMIDGYLEVAPAAAIGQASHRRPRNSFKARAYLLLMYAHWEGFAKEAFKNYYLEVCSQVPDVLSLNDALLGIAARRTCRDAAVRRSPAALGALVADVRASSTSFSMPPGNQVVVTKSNLTVARTRELLDRFGFDPASLQPWELTTIKPLVEQRNAIAHGAGLTIDEARYAELHHSILDLLDALKDLLQTAAATGRHLRR